MAQERSGTIIMVVVAMLIGIASANSFNVGDNSGWTFGVSSWPNGKTFAAGDTLVFKYAPANHNVVTVNKAGYDSCTVQPQGAPVVQTGNDQITLQKGDNYFICSIPGHCLAGMKIAATTN